MYCFLMEFVASFYRFDKSLATSYGLHHEAWLREWNSFPFIYVRKTGNSDKKFSVLLYFVSSYKIAGFEGICAISCFSYAMIQKKYKDVSMMFGIRLRLLRCLAGLTQAQLGDKLNVTAGALGMYEQGRRMPSLSTIVEISEVFEVSCDFLLGGSELSEKEECMEMMVLMFAILAQRIGKGVREKERC